MMRDFWPSSSRVDMGFIGIKPDDEHSFAESLRLRQANIFQITLLKNVVLRTAFLFLLQYKYNTLWAGVNIRHLTFLYLNGIATRWSVMCYASKILVN